MTILEVTESMDGHVGAGVADSNQGEIKGILDGTTFAHEVRIHIEDIDAFIKDDKHAASMSGQVECRLLGGKRDFEGGTFNMLVKTAAPSLRVMLYRIPVKGADGKAYTVLGNKTIHDDHSLDLLSDIMTLTVAIFEGDVPGPLVATPVLGEADVPGVALARGVIRIRSRGAGKKAFSFDSPDGELKKLVAEEKFLRFYGTELWELYR